MEKAGAKGQRTEAGGKTHQISLRLAEALVSRHCLKVLPHRCASPTADPSAVNCPNLHSNALPTFGRGLTAGDRGELIIISSVSRPVHHKMYELYIDIMSQPSRALLILCRLNAKALRGQVEEKRTLIHKKEHKTEEYARLNPLGQIPCLVKRGETGKVSFALPESCAILRHLCERFDLSDQWYPSYSPSSSDVANLLERQAHVDSALHWYHSTLRAGCGGLTFHKVVAYNLGKKPVEAIALDSKARLDRALGQLETHWLRGKSFVGGDLPCVADLLFCCEIEQLNMLYFPTDGVDIESILNGFPGVRAWMARVAKQTGPVYEEVHKLLRYAARKRHERLSQRSRL